jgi:hypothetical protein
MQKKDFESYTGRGFHVKNGRSILVLELVRSRDLPGRNIPGFRDAPFALLFRGPKLNHHDEALTRQIHELTSEDGKKFSIYLEPITSTGDPGMLYEAIFD